MSEYSDSMSITKILGSSPGYVGYNETNTVLDRIRQNPTAVILLDEIDKAHREVINLLYQMLDTGEIRDSKGNTIKLNNNIILMTSNIGFEEIKVGFNENNNQNIISKLNEQFNTSLINRIDNIIIFNKLTIKDITIIVKNKLNKLKEKYKEYHYDQNTVKEIIKEVNYEKYGARQIDKIIERKIESNIIDNIIIKAEKEIPL